MPEFKILLFGITKEIIGKPEVSLQDSSIVEVRDLLFQLKEEYPALKKLKSLMVAVNNEYAQSNQKLFNHDEIALIPPVSGG
ncbi:MAG: MoaD/ThiS family protein [Bacteroidota bacterium]|jgi:molybdopterin synthase sulfur carrier subunit|nr:MoaD/ThiS family protein [Bacteroidota bacterium]